MSEWTDCECPIWETPAKKRVIRNRDASEFNSPRAGGVFTLSRSAEVNLRNRDDKTAVAVSTAILDANLNHAPIVVLSEEIQRLSSLPLRTVKERFNNFIRAAEFSEPRFGRAFLDEDDSGISTVRLLLAATENPDPRSDYLDGRQGIEPYIQRGISRNLMKRSGPQVYLTLDGHEYVEELGVSAFESSSIFVAMWFGSAEVNDFYRFAVRPAIEAAGYRCVRIDDVHHNDRIDEMILAEIRKSRAVFVDITCGIASPSGWGGSDSVGAPRGGVYFEAGFAAGLGKPIIWSVDERIANIENVVHFDVRQYNQVRWKENHEENLSEIRARIEATLGRGDRRP